MRQARSAGALFLVPIEPLEKVERFTAVFAGAFQRPPVSLLAFCLVGSGRAGELRGGAGGTVDRWELALDLVAHVARAHRHVSAFS